MAAKLYEAKTFRILCHWVHYNFSVIATREVLLKSCKKHLVVYILVKIADINLSFTACLVLICLRLGWRTACLKPTHEVTVSTHLSSALTCEHASAAHFWSVHPSWATRSTRTNTSLSRHLPTTSLTTFAAWSVLMPRSAV